MTDRDRLIASAINILKFEGKIVVEDDRIYLAGYHAHEKALAERIRELTQAKCEEIKDAQ